MYVYLSTTAATEIFFTKSESKAGAFYNTFEHLSYDILYSRKLYTNLSSNRRFSKQL